jgi:ADP-heptose:LPS heptosyltransferase
MNLEFAIPLFQLKHIHWVVITKNITNQEKCILKRNNVLFLGDKLDNGEKCFEDSIAVIKDVTGVISTDTSIVHLAANLNIPTTVLLTFGCEWRWTNDKTTNWYPDMTLVRQEKQGDWKSVIEKVISII